MPRGPCSHVPELELGILWVTVLILGKPLSPRPMPQSSNISHGTSTQIQLPRALFFSPDFTAHQPMSRVQMHLHWVMKHSSLGKGRPLSKDQPVFVLSSGAQPCTQAFHKPSISSQPFPKQLLQLLLSSPHLHHLLASLSAHDLTFFFMENINRPGTNRRRPFLTPQ